MLNHNNSVCLVLLTVAVTRLQAVAQDAGEHDSLSTITLQSVVENVDAHEELYGRLQTLAVTEYQLQLPDELRDSDHILSETRRHHEVVDGARRSVETEKRGANVAGQSLDEDYRYGYDGVRTRTLMQQPEHGLSIGNLHDGPADAAYQFRPHTVLLQKAFVGDMRLSEFLGCERFHNYHFRASILGEEALSLNDGDAELVRCLKLQCEAWVDGQDEPDFRYLWLAVDRNYLPVKSVGYAVGYSREIPLEIGRVLELREVADGVHFPVQVEIQTYYELDAAAGKTTPSNLIAVSVEEIDFDPVISDELFSEIDFPEGTMVYELDASGELISSFTVGPSIPARSTVSLIILVSSLAIIAVLIYFALRAWRKRSAPA